MNYVLLFKQARQSPTSSDLSHQTSIDGPQVNPDDSSNTTRTIDEYQSDRNRSTFLQGSQPSMEQQPTPIVSVFPLEIFIEIRGSLTAESGVPTILPDALQTNEEGLENSRPLEIAKQQEPVVAHQSCVSVTDASLST